MPPQWHCASQTWPAFSLGRSQARAHGLQPYSLVCRFSGVHPAIHVLHGLPLRRKREKSVPVYGTVLQVIWHEFYYLPSPDNSEVLSIHCVAWLAADAIDRFHNVFIYANYMLSISVYLLHLKYSICSLVSKRCRKLVELMWIVGCMTKMPTIYHNQPVFDICYKLNYIYNI